MKRLLFTAISLVSACVLAVGLLAAAGANEDQEEETSNAKPDAGGVVIDPSSGKIAEGDQITITFRWRWSRPISSMSVISRVRSPANQNSMARSFGKVRRKACSRSVGSSLARVPG